MFIAASSPRHKGESMDGHHHEHERILVIRLGALGDLVLCAPAFQAIRAAHPRAKIALLTQPAWMGFAGLMPWFDTVISDKRPPGIRYRRMARSAGTHSRFWADQGLRSSGQDAPKHYILASGRPFERFEWSGAAGMGSHPRVWPPRPEWHFADFIGAQLQAASITVPAAADWSWLDAPVDSLALPEKFVLLIPGCSPTRLDKRWPPARYAALARDLYARASRRSP
ncbi:MAG: hypothetical protein WDO70_07250 [Alphaproteobacteria bacterium]